MRAVNASWINDDGERVVFPAELSDIAVHDLIRFFENATGDEEYEEGDFAGDDK